MIEEPSSRRTEDEVVAELVAVLRGLPRGTVIRWGESGQSDAGGQGQIFVYNDYEHLLGGPPPVNGSARVVCATKMGVQMGIGITFLGGDVRTVAEASRRAEVAGLDAVWTTEFLDRSSTVSLAAMANATGRVRIGSAIMHAVGRSPFVLASEARDIDELSGGRFVLGLGTGTKGMIRDWHGEDPTAPALRIEELVPVIRMIWRLHEEPVDHSGDYYHVKIRPTSDLRAPIRERIPIYLAAVNDRMVRAVGTVGDGLIVHPLVTREYLGDSTVPALVEGARRGGRSRSDIGLAGYVICSIADDIEVARREAKAQIAFYSVVKTYRPMLESQGWGGAADRIRSAWLRGDSEEMIRAVPDDMVDRLAVAAEPPGAVEQLARTAAGACDDVLLYPPAFLVDPARLAENVDAIIDVFGGTSG